MNRRRGILVLGLAVLAGLLVYGIHRTRAQQQTGADELATAIATVGNFEKTVNATGNLAPAEEVSLSFGSPGRVAEVAVRVGDRVVPGQVLAKLDSRDLELSLAAAAAEMEVAESNLTSARQALATLEAGPDARALEEAKIELEQAKNRLWSVQAQRDATCGRVKEKRAQQVDCDVAQSSVYQAEGTVRAAQLKLDDVQDGPSASEIAAARDKVQQAEAGLASAQVRYHQAELALAEATLTSPITGTVTALNVSAGEAPAGGQAASGPHVVVSNLDAFQLTVYAAESDVAEIAVGQPATVTLDVFAGETLEGEVIEVAPTGSVESGVVLYPVTVRVAPGKLAARAGMTANVDIVTVSRPKALMVPVRAVMTTAEGSYVLRLAGAAASASPPAGRAAVAPVATVAPGGADARGSAPVEPPAGAVVIRADGPFAGGPPAGIFAEGRFRGSGNRRGAASAGGSSASTTGWRARLADAERVPVKLGPANDSVVVIESGLREGDIVLVASTTSSNAGGTMRLPWEGIFGVRQR